MHTVDKLGTKVVRGSEQFLNFNGTYSDCWQRKDVWFYLRLIVRASHLCMLLCCVLAIICVVTGMYAKITIVTIGTIRVNKCPIFNLIEPLELSLFSLCILHVMSVK